MTTEQTEQTLNLADLNTKTRDELDRLAISMGLENGSAMSELRRDELTQKLVQAFAEHQGVLLASGVLEVMNEGYGFLRQSGMIKLSVKDVYVSQSQIRRFGLRTGDKLTGHV